MAWIENELWIMEQGLDASIEFHLFTDQTGTIPWPFLLWQLKATLSDETGKTVLNLTIETEPQNGVVRLRLPELTVNTLRPIQTYRYDCLMIAPGNMQGDDHYLATGPVKVALRTSRRST